MRSVLLAITAIVMAALIGPAGTASAGRTFIITTHLNNEQEVPTPVATTNGQGQFFLKLNEDNTEARFKLNVANIENVTQAHIHVITAPNAQTGGIVVWLYPAAPPLQLIPGRSAGVLSEGTFDASNLVGSLAGQTLEDLIDAIEDGRAYVNVHTSQNPPGEIRGNLICNLR